MIGLVPIMIFRRHPEKCQDRPLDEGLQLLCKANGGEGFVEGVEGALAPRR